MRFLKQSTIRGVEHLCLTSLTTKMGWQCKGSGPRVQTRVTSAENQRTWSGSVRRRCRSDIDGSVRVHDGDLIFSWSGTLLLDFWAGGDAGLNQHLFKVSSEKYEPWFYYLWTNYHMRKFIAIAKDRATTMGHIKRSALVESEVYIPSENRMFELGRLFNPLIEEMVSSIIESRKLSILRDVLLPKLMSGEVDVGMIEVTEWPI